MEPSVQANVVDPELPKRIGRYEAFLQIGAGGMARVYLGVQNGPFAAKKIVVIKQVRPEIAADQQCLAMFIDEARIALRLNHPNVVHTYEVLDEAPDYYLVMEFLDGQSLLDVLRRIGREKVPLEEHIWILTQLLAGLHYAHELRDFDGQPLDIVHRDVTPSNVFICRSGTVKLLDFGIAKASGAVAATRNGVLKGKLGYVAPEQCLGDPAGVRSDIYAVGVMLWEAMARKRRVTGDTQAAQVHARIHGSEPPIERVWPDAPASLAAICRRALSLMPEQRYSSARDFQRDLERYLQQQQSRAGAESVSRLLRPYFERERAALYRAIEQQLGEHEQMYSRPSPPPPPPPVSGRVPVGEISVSVSNPLLGASPSQPVPSATSSSWRPVERPRFDEEETSKIVVDDALLRASTPESRRAIAHRHLRSQLRLWGERIAAHVRSLVFRIITMHVQRNVAFAIGASLAAVATLWMQLGLRGHDEVESAESAPPAAPSASPRVTTEAPLSLLVHPQRPKAVVPPAAEQPVRNHAPEAVKQPEAPTEATSPAEGFEGRALDPSSGDAPGVVNTPAAALPLEVEVAAAEPAGVFDEGSEAYARPVIEEPPPAPEPRKSRKSEDNDRLAALAESASDPEPERSEFGTRSGMRSQSARGARVRAARASIEARLTGSVEPGMELRTPTHPQRSIDEEDPYEP